MRADDPNAGPMLRKRFRRHPRQVAQARAFVAGALAGGSQLQETARLLVSETVTSTLAQSPAGQEGGTFEVGYALVEDRLHVEVSDGGDPLGCGAASTGCLGGWPGVAAGAGPGAPLGGAGESDRADHLV